MKRPAPSVIGAIFAGLLLANTVMAQGISESDHLTQCIRMAEPLVQNPDLIFPLTENEINNVCGKWDDFINCIHEYMTTYLTPTQREDFNKAIESTIQSIGQLCIEDSDYKTKYMVFAPCMKRVSVNASLCGNHYRHLADLVQTSSTGDADLCCSHQHYRSCVLDATPRECDSVGGAQGTGPTALQFMEETLDRVLGFLLQKCKASYYSSEECQVSNGAPFGNALNPSSTVAKNASQPSSGVQDPETQKSNTDSSPSPPPSLAPPKNVNLVPKTPPEDVQPNEEIPSINLAGNPLFFGGGGGNEADDEDEDDAKTQEYRGAASVNGGTPVLNLVVFVFSTVWVIQ